MVSQGDLDALADMLGMAGGGVQLTKPDGLRRALMQTATRIKLLEERAGAHGAPKEKGWRTLYPPRA